MFSIWCLLRPATTGITIGSRRISISFESDPDGPSSSSRPFASTSSFRSVIGEFNESLSRMETGSRARARDVDEFGRERRALSDERESLDDERVLGRWFVLYLLLLCSRLTTFDVLTPFLASRRHTVDCECVGGRGWEKHDVARSLLHFADFTRYEFTTFVFRSPLSFCSARIQPLPIYEAIEAQVLRSTTSFPKRSDSRLPLTFLQDGYHQVVLRFHNFSNQPSWLYGRSC